MTTNTAVNFDRYAQEGNSFIKELSESLNHPREEDRAQVGRLLRAVLHTLREQISTGQSLNLISQFPLFLKALYVDQWQYKETQERIKSLKEFIAAAEQMQSEKGEVTFDWEEPTEILVKRMFIALSKYISEGELKDVAAELPEEIRHFLEEEIIEGNLDR